jgi:Xaa-Pro aminopeptidase
MQLQQSGQSIEHEPPVPGGETPAEPRLPFDDAALRRHRERRDRFLARLGGGVAVLPAATTQYRSRDTEVRFRQNTDFFYLTGFQEPDAVAVFSPHEPARPFTLFVRPRDPDRELWEGARAGVEGACELYGADAAHPIAELETHLRSLLEPADRIHYEIGAHPGLDRTVIELLRGFRRSRQRSGTGPTGLADPGEILGELRLVKDAFELDCIRTAAAIAARGHREAMAAARPGAGEWEVEAVLEGTFRLTSATGPAFPSIVAAGASATVLHYVANDRRVREGDLVLIDAGAEWAMYCSDITRTFPASGRFTPVQRALYDLVLEAEEAAIRSVAPGAPFSGIHDAALDVIVPGLVRLGLLQGDPRKLREDGAYKRFFMHQTSHWLGLDVHDVGLYARGGESVTLQPGMVLTVEPGIYVPADADGVPPGLRDVGIRIEDVVVVTESGREVLTRGVPVEAEAVERVVEAGRRE